MIYFLAEQEKQPVHLAVCNTDFRNNHGPIQWTEIAPIEFQNSRNNNAVTILDLIRNVARYMREKLTDCSFTTAGRIAREIIYKYPKAFETASWVDESGTVVDDGYKSLKTRIYDCARYKDRKSNSNSDTIKSNPQADQTACNYPIERYNKNQDVYGCVAYEPPLPENETAESQSKKKMKLLKDFKGRFLTEKEVAALMEETYSSQRVALNTQEKQGLTLKMVLDEHWPYLKTQNALYNHASILIGHDVVAVWKINLEKKGSSILSYFELEIKSKKGKSNCPTYITRCLEELRFAKAASEELRCDIPKFISIFPMLAAYFAEEKLFTIVVSVSVLLASIN